MKLLAIDIYRKQTFHHPFIALVYKIDNGNIYAFTGVTGKLEPEYSPGIVIEPAVYTSVFGRDGKTVARYSNNNRFDSEHDYFTYLTKETVDACLEQGDFDSTDEFMSTVVKQHLEARDKYYDFKQGYIFKWYEEHYGKPYVKWELEVAHGIADKDFDNLACYELGFYLIYFNIPFIDLSFGGLRKECKGTVRSYSGTWADKCFRETYHKYFGRPLKHKQEECRYARFIKDSKDILAKPKHPEVEKKLKEIEEYERLNGITY